MRSTNLDIPEDGINCSTKLRLLEMVSQLEPSQRRPGLAEAATRTLLASLAARRPLYPGFEEKVWRQFLEASDLEEEIESLLDS